MKVTLNKAFYFRSFHSIFIRCFFNLIFNLKTNTENKGETQMEMVKLLVGWSCLVDLFNEKNYSLQIPCVRYIDPNMTWMFFSYGK